MFKRRGSPLTKILNQWTSLGGDLWQALSDFEMSIDEDEYVKSAAEAKAICNALHKLREAPERIQVEDDTTPLNTLASLFEKVATSEAALVLKSDGLPLLRKWYQEHIEGNHLKSEDFFRILETFAHCHDLEDTLRIAKCVQMKTENENSAWSSVFWNYRHNHPHAVELINAIRSPIPEGNIAIALLELSNYLSIEGRLAYHPFDSNEGYEQLEPLLRFEDEENISLAIDATLAIAFIDKVYRDRLLPIAMAHIDPYVQLESAWAQGKAGDEAGLERLAAYCLDLRYGLKASEYLEELGYAELIPLEALEPKFVACKRMSDWLSHPMEFGSPPESVSVYDSRTLFWPPTNDEQTIWLIEYRYPGEDKPLNYGIGMVGSTVFSVLLPKPSAETSKEDWYAIYCSWEYQWREDNNSFTKPSAEHGRKLLREKNEGF